MPDPDIESIIGTIRIVGRLVRIELDDPLQRDAVVERLGYFDVEPLKMFGAPAFPLEESPNQAVRVSEMTVSHYRSIVRLANAGVMAVPPEPALLDYMRKRIEFEEKWAARNPDKYRTITLTGALADWSGLLAVFRNLDRQTVSLQTIESMQAAAVEAGRKKGD